MKNIVLFTLLFFTNLKLSSQIHQFVQLSIFPNETQKVDDVIELNNYYYFKSSFIVNPHTSKKSIIYKTNLLGSLIDSVELKSGNNDTSIIIPHLFITDNNTIKLYGIKGIQNSTALYNFYTDIKYVIYELDTNLNIVTYSEYTNTDPSIINLTNVIQIKNKLYLIHPTIDSAGSKIVVLNSDGDFLFSKYIPDSLSTPLLTICEHPDNNNLILGPGSWNYNVNFTDTFLQKYSAVSITQQPQLFLGSGTIGCFPFDNSKFLYLNSYVPPFANTQDSICASIIDTLGIIQKRTCLQPPINQLFNSSDCFFNLYDYKKPSKELFLGGNINMNYPTSIIQVAKLDSNLNVIWNKNIGNDNQYFASNIYSSKDGGCFVVGNYFDSESIPLVLKLDSLGVITTTINLSKKINNQVICYPNPTSFEITFLASEMFFGSNATIYNSLGHIIKKIKINNAENNLDISCLPCGYYFYEIINTRNQKAVGKFLKN